MSRKERCPTCDQLVGHTTIKEGLCNYCQLQKEDDDEKKERVKITTENLIETYEALGMFAEALNFRERLDTFLQEAE